MKIIFKISKNEIRRANKCCEYIGGEEGYRCDCSNCPLGVLDDGDLLEYLCCKVSELDEKRDYAIGLVYRRVGKQIIATEVIESEEAEDDSN